MGAEEGRRMGIRRLIARIFGRSGSLTEVGVRRHCGTPRGGIRDGAADGPQGTEVALSSPPPTETSAPLQRVQIDRHIGPEPVAYFEAIASEDVEHLRSDQAGSCPTIECFTHDKTGVAHVSEQFLCSDQSCPCPGTEPLIPGETGFLYISKEVVEWRCDALTLEECRRKVKTMADRLDVFLVATPGVVNPILLCQEAQSVEASISALRRLMPNTYSGRAGARCARPQVKRLLIGQREAARREDTNMAEENGIERLLSANLHLLIEPPTGLRGAPYPLTGWSKSSFETGRHPLGPARSRLSLTSRMPRFANRARDGKVGR